MHRNGPTPPADFPALRAMSRRLGSDSTLVQGSGGNTSVKDGDVLWVKASGTWLTNAESQDILVPVDLHAVQEILATGGSDFNNTTLGGTLLPSIETSLHCQLTHHIVAHVHSVNAIAWNVQVGAKARLEELLDGIDWRYISYAKPGASLTAEVNRVLAEQPGEPNLLVLENHGLVLGGDTCESVEKLLAEVESRLNIEPRETAEPDATGLSAAVENIDGWRLPHTPDVHAIALDAESIGIATGGVLIPDHAVFLDKQVPICDSPEEIADTLNQFRSSTGQESDWMIVRGSGIVLTENIGAAGEEQLRGLAMIGLRIPVGATIRYIDARAAEDLRAWDMEIYRKKLDDELSKKSSSPNDQ